MAWQKGQVITGARARFTIGGKAVGFASSVGTREEIRYEQIEVLDNIQVQEHVPVGYYVSMNAGTVRLFDRSFRSAEINIWPKVGADPQEHLANILAQAQANLNAILQEVVSNRSFMHLTEVNMASRNMQVTARGIVGEDVDFNAITAKDESED